MFLLTRRVYRRLGHCELTIVDETLFRGSYLLQWKSASPTAGLAIRTGSISANYRQFCKSSDGSRELQQNRPMRTKGAQPTWICKTGFPFQNQPVQLTFRFTSDSSRFTINDLVLSEISQPDSLPFRATALHGKSWAELSNQKATVLGMLHQVSLTWRTIIGGSMLSNRSAPHICVADVDHQQKHSDFKSLLRWLSNLFKSIMILGIGSPQLVPSTINIFGCIAEALF